MNRDTIVTLAIASFAGVFAGVLHHLFGKYIPTIKRDVITLTSKTVNTSETRMDLDKIVEKHTVVYDLDSKHKHVFRLSLVKVFIFAMFGAFASALITGVICLSVCEYLIDVQLFGPNKSSFGIGAVSLLMSVTSILGAYFVGWRMLCDVDACDKAERLRQESDNLEHASILSQRPWEWELWIQEHPDGVVISENTRVIAGEKYCTHCKKRVHAASIEGEHCPHCGAYWKDLIVKTTT